MKFNCNKQRNVTGSKRKFLENRFKNKKKFAENNHKIKEIQPFLVNESQENKFYNKNSTTQDFSIGGGNKGSNRRIESNWE